MFSFLFPFSTVQRNGLLIFIDNGRTGQAEQPQKKTIVKEFTSLDTENIGDQTNSARIYINTLSSINDFRAGSYALTDLKKMSGTKSFLDLPLAKKQCHIGPVEDCQTQKYAVEVQMKCGCVPWVLSSALGLEVNS